MTFNDAINILKTGDGHTGEAMRVVYHDVEAACETRTDGNDGQETTLADWLVEGQYSGTETAESIAAEWDSLSRQSSGDE